MEGRLIILAVTLSYGKTYSLELKALTKAAHISRRQGVIIASKELQRK